MEFFKSVKSAFKSAGGAVQNAVDVVAEKNRKSALINRLRTVIRCEEKAAERAYLALGRYYYHNMRDAANAETENYCVGIDAAEKRIEEAMLKLEALNHEELEEVTEEPVVSPEEVRLFESESIADEAVPEGFVDEAVEPAEPVQELTEEEPDDSEGLPYA